MTERTVTVEDLPAEFERLATMATSPSHTNIWNSAADMLRAALSSDHQGEWGESEFVRLRKRLLGEAVEAVAKQGYAAVQKPYYDEGDWEAMSQEERDRWTDPIRNIVAKAWNEATGHADFSLAPDQPPVDHSTQPDQDRSPGEGAEQRSPQPDPQDQEGRAVTVESIRQAFANGYWLKAAHRMIEAALDAALPSTEPTESKGEREINRCAGTGRRRNIMWPLEGPKHVPCPGCPDCQPPDPTEGQQGGGEDGDVDPATHHTAGEQGGDRG